MVAHAPEIPRYPSLKRRTFVEGLAVLGAAFAMKGFLIHLPELRPRREAYTTELHPGVMYYRDVRSVPRPLMIHTVMLDLKQDAINLFVTPGELSAEGEIRASTTRDFLETYHTDGFAVAVNANFFEPFHAHTPWDYYPRKNDPVALRGVAVSDGDQYSSPEDNYPAICIVGSEVEFTEGVCDDDTDQGIAGNRWLVKDGLVIDYDDGVLHPRTAIGISSDQLIITCIDGRQKYYSEGVTVGELAQIMADYGVEQAINFDGGGSTSLDYYKDGKIHSLNSPIHTSIWGRERPVGNHLGVIIR